MNLPIRLACKHRRTARAVIHATEINRRFEDYCILFRGQLYNMIQTRQLLSRAALLLLLPLVLLLAMVTDVIGIRVVDK